MVIIIDDDDISITDKGHGKKKNQKLKAYLVLQFLMRHSDENNTVSAEDIVAHLMECGIYAERRRQKEKRVLCSPAPLRSK